MSVDRWNHDRDGRLNEQALRDKMERRGYVVTRYDYPPGTCFPTHVHGVDKIDAVLEGRFRITLDDESAILEPGDIIAVPSGAPHSAEVVGDVTVVSLDGVRRA